MAGNVSESADRLIWLAAAVVAAMGLAWLFVESPWSTGAEPVESVATLDAIAAPGSREPAAADETASAAEPAPASTPANDTLHLAELALDAGMLVEPADYSAWALFGRVAAAEPANPDARNGLERVAEGLLGRGRTALEQGRYDDAGTIAATILERLPDHAGALALKSDIVTATTPPEPVVATKPPEEKLVAATPKPVDPIPALNEAFENAMARNAVLTPPGTSARDIVKEMIATAPDHKLTIAARDLLVTEMLGRSAQSIEARDTAAAQTWIDSAAPLAADSQKVDRARDALKRYQIETESQKLRPASDLKQLKYQPPEYPQTALNRGIEGWVEVGFTVAPDGTTADVTVLDASHERYFRAEAVAAVEGWRFEPVVFMGEAIPQRAYTRLAFEIN
jgi:TonB family protein